MRPTEATAVSGAQVSEGGKQSLMIEAGFYNMDCMDAMRQFPDKFFDLAIVDPPYGSGGVHSQTVSDSAKDLTVTAQIVRGGGTTSHKRTAERTESTELVERGRRSSQKNYCVGRSTRRRLLQRTFPRLTKSDYLGCKLFFFTACSVLCHMGENERYRKLFDGDGRICVGINRRQCEDLER